MGQLDGKVSMLTGGASGIGKEITKRFASEGAKVLIADLQLPAAEATANEISRSGGVAMGVAMDVNNESAVDAGVAATAERYGGVDILVSNAGIQIVKPIDEFPFGEWKKRLAIHLDGAFLTTKATGGWLRGVIFLTAVWSLGPNRQGSDGRPPRARCSPRYPGLGRTAARPIRPATAIMTSVDRPRVVVLGGGFGDYRRRAPLRRLRSTSL
jgi:NAD(P)-dependent dehydrogenase (short-subunit alcohol dehydrogenase family)